MGAMNALKLKRQEGSLISIIESGKINKFDEYYKLSEHEDDNLIASVM